MKPVPRQVQNGFMELSPFCFLLQNWFSLFLKLIFSDMHILFY